MTTFVNPYTYIADPTRGRPVFNGRVFFGNPDTDPVQPENRVTVSLVNENGTLTALMQPIATGPGGVAMVNGNPAQLDIALTQYSMTIQNGLGVQIYYSPRVSIGTAGGPDPTDLLNQFSRVGTPRFITAANNMGNPFPYQIHARVIYNPGTGDRIYESLGSNNTTLPTDNTRWQNAGAAAIDTRNDARYYTQTAATNLFVRRANNLSDLADGSIARTNLGLEANGGDITASTDLTRTFVARSGPFGVVMVIASASALVAGGGGPTQLTVDIGGVSKTVSVGGDTGSQEGWSITVPFTRTGLAGNSGHGVGLTFQTTSTRSRIQTTASWIGL